VKTIATAAALLACAAAPARAQAVRPAPATGDEIRVSPAAGAPFTGRLIAFGSDVVLLRPDGGGDEVRVSVSAQPVEVRRRPRERWSGFGAVIGTAAGVASALAFNHSPGSPHRTDVAIVGGAAGGVVGGLFGFTVAPRRWQRLRVAPAAAPLPPPAQTATAAHD
jgi:hypothetical protein